MSNKQCTNERSAISFKRTLLASACAALASSIALPTLAANDNTGQGGRSNIEEVMVTGQKIERSLQETKESVAIFTAADIKERGLIDLHDVMLQTAGLSGEGSSFRIRGINSGDIGTQRGELASYYVDGVALSGFAKSEGPRDLWDVAQVEVLRGPQSTNLGRNALAGAIVVNTNDPVYLSESSIRTGFASNTTYDVAGMINVVLNEGVSALRFTAEQTGTDGHTNNVTRNEDDYAGSESRTARMKWLYEPSDALRMVTALQYTDNERGDKTVSFDDSGFGVKREDRVSHANTDAIYENETWQASLKLDYSINSTWQLHSITALQDSSWLRLDDFDNGPAGPDTVGGEVNRHADDENVSQELRFNYTSDNIRGSTGVYYSRVDSHNVNDTATSLDLVFYEPALAPLVQLGVYPAYYDLKTGGSNELETTNMAIFSEWDVDRNNWTFSFGARYDKEEQKGNRVDRGSSSVVLPNPANYVATPFGDLSGFIFQVNQILSTFSGNTSNPMEAEYDALLPHIGATYHLSESSAVSFFAKRGYRAGGSEVDGLGLLNEFDPEYLSNYELALRSELFDGSAILNANLYYGDWKDQQVQIPLLGSVNILRIENAGESKIAGLEVDFQYQVSELLSLFATAGYNTTEYKQFVTSIGDFSGNEFARAPEVTAALGGSYTFSNHYFIHANTVYESDSYADEQNTLTLKAHALVNLRAGYEAEQFKVEGFIKNALDKDYATSQFRGAGRMGAPREIGARLLWNF